MSNKDLTPQNNHIETKIREPRQKRSIEKKQKIIKAGLELICQNGYHSTTTADIAKKAGVSTGIVYSYFKDKKDILLSGLNDYISEKQAPTYDFLTTLSPDDDFDATLENLIDHFADSHKLFRASHQELTALSAMDKDIGSLFYGFEKKMVASCATIYARQVKPLPHLYEKFHMVYQLIELYCHESVIHPSPDVDYDVMRRETISCIKHLLEI